MLAQKCSRLSIVTGDSHVFSVMQPRRLTERWDGTGCRFGSAITLTVLRYVLRRENLYDTAPPGVPEAAPPLPNPRHRTVRTVDGTYNDLEHPNMGSAGTRFGRNVPIGETYPEKDEKLLSPNPRTVSLDLMTRRTFQPAATLNVLAAAWLQFMVRDWLRGCLKSLTQGRSGLA
jgi:Animal haem peroxidase